MQTSKCDRRLMKELSPFDKREELNNDPEKRLNLERSNKKIGKNSA